MQKVLENERQTISPSNYHGPEGGIIIKNITTNPPPNHPHLDSSPLGPLATSNIQGMQTQPISDEGLRASLDWQSLPASCPP